MPSPVQKTLDFNAARNTHTISKRPAPFALLPGGHVVAPTRLLPRPSTVAPAYTHVYCRFLACRQGCILTLLSEAKATQPLAPAADIPCTVELVMTESPPNPYQPVTVAFSDLAAWTKHFHAADIPVLDETAQALEALRANQDNTDANSIGEMISNDPLMTLKVLAHASEHCGRHVISDTETVTAALVMMGISPFFDAFGMQPTVEARLQLQPRALQGLRDVLKRAHRGANFALGFAVHRRDPHAAVIHAATLLHEFAEMLLWCHAPALALRIHQEQAADHTLRSVAVQRRVLNVVLADLQTSLMQSWRLPRLLSHLSDVNYHESTAVRTVELAARLARHTAQGWDNPAIPDDISETATLLNLSTAAALQWVQEI